MKNSEAERIAELEIRVAEQEHSIEELSQSLTEHWKMIEALKARLKGFEDRLSVLEEGGGAGIPVTKPPHW